ncbi:hypothetical protein CONLIGDRAFT_674609 [Coniochaeta ligniaria NRRL 30616]|uniref:Uncharacterized protein n=1 Tax=Coniochaeta ligniaria NRRL 30616 TaxID=1408157 RepID=A0A1J7J6L2_9PEZI|nr:hypothetical protein CONLIGDRAFT_674609 [Coniochaeta ligniaria NRRL 30616]
MDQQSTTDLANMASNPIPPASTPPFPFRRLPPELQTAIRFESGLDQHDALALTIALSPPESECALVHAFMTADLSWTDHEGTLPLALSIQQTIHRHGAVHGSFDRASWAGCKQALHDDNDQELDDDDGNDGRLAVKFTAMQDVMRRTQWAYMIKDACDANWRGFLDGEGDGLESLSFPLGHTVSREGCFGGVTRTELVRLVLAVHQFDVYTARLNEGTEYMSYQEAADLSKGFFRYLTPWEKEQIICVGEIMAQVFQQDIEELRLKWNDTGFDPVGDLVFDPVEGKAFTHEDRVFNCLMRYHRQRAGEKLTDAFVARTMIRTLAFNPDINEFALSRCLNDDDETIRMGLYYSFLSETTPWSVLLEKWAWSGAEEMVVRARVIKPDLHRRLNMHRDRDRDGGPRMAWEEDCVRAKITGDYAELTSLRAVGYVFWDEYRRYVNCVAGLFDSEDEISEDELSPDLSEDDSEDDEAPGADEGAGDGQLPGNDELSGGAELQVAGDDEAACDDEVAGDDESSADGELLGGNQLSGGAEMLEQPDGL